MQEVVQQERFAPQNLQFPAAAQVQDIHLCKSFGGKHGTNGRQGNAFLSSERAARDCMFHNQKNGGSFSAYNLHICCSISRQFKVTEITVAPQ